MNTLTWISADKIHNGKTFFPRTVFIAMDAQGVIRDIQEKKPPESVQHYEGWITPGFVNVHCHLELSHMKGMIPKGTGLIEFLKTVIRSRNDIAAKQKRAALRSALDNAIGKGIVAFGDICNTTESIPAKKEAPAYFHSFIEALGKVPERAGTAMQYAEGLLSSFRQLALDDPEKYNQSIIPHAPYSVSDELIGLINRHDEESLISIHNQEVLAETELFEKGTGPMLAFLKDIRIPPEIIRAKNKNSLQWVLDSVTDTHNLILVHNTYIGKEDIDKVQGRAGTTYFCLCPNANVYIENRLPPVPLLAEKNMNLCIGTDSLASNYDICIFSEIKTIRQHFPELEWEQLISWATWGGAGALNIRDTAGTLSIGMRPGLVHIPPAQDRAYKLA